MELFDPRHIASIGEPTAEARFRAFHGANPGVYEDLARRTRALKARGYAHVGIRMLWEAMRHDWMLATTDPGSTFKLNNNYAPFYARLLMTQEADLTGIFETRGETA